MDIEKVVEISTKNVHFRIPKLRLNVPPINSEIIYNTFRLLLKQAFSLHVDIGDKIAKELDGVAKIVEFMYAYNTVFESDLSTVLHVMRNAAYEMAHSHGTTDEASRIISFLVAEDLFRDPWESYIDNILVEYNETDCIVNKIRAIHVMIERYNQHVTVPISPNTMANNVLCNFMKRTLDNYMQGNYIMKTIGLNHCHIIETYETHTAIDVVNSADILCATPKGVVLYKEMNDMFDDKFMFLNELDVDYVRKTFQFMKDRVAHINDDSEANITAHEWTLPEDRPVVSEGAPILKNPTPTTNVSGPGHQVIYPVLDEDYNMH
jgi:hypothetical protein